MSKDWWTSQKGHKLIFKSHPRYLESSWISYKITTETFSAPGMHPRHTVATN